MTNMKSCTRCKHLVKYTGENGNWMNVCEGDEVESDGDGLYLVTTVAVDEFDASECLIFSLKEAP